MASPKSPVQKPFNIAIIGGGIAGLTLAIGLLRLNIPITLYESAAKFGEIGAGVGFDPSAVFAMEGVDPRIKEGFLRCAMVNQGEKDDVWFTVRVGDSRKAGENGVVKGKEKEGLKVGDPVFQTLHTVPGPRGGVHRAHFLDELVKLIPDTVARFGKKLVDITHADSGDVVLHFADGTTAQHNAVIGCDGIKSRARQVLLGKDCPGASKPVFSGKYAYRGLIPMSKAIEVLGEEHAITSQMYVGYHGHVLTFPIERGKTMNVVAFSSRETWNDPNWVVTTPREKMLADYAGWGPAVQFIISSMQKPDIWALFNHLPAPTYYKSRICLVGDAAHATTPHQGAGACFCVEDCYILCGLMAEAQTLDDLDKVFRSYDEVRRPRTQKLVKTSKEAAMVYEFESEEGDDLDKIERNMQERMKWIWQVDLPAELERARNIYRDDSKI